MDANHRGNDYRPDAFIPAVPSRNQSGEREQVRVEYFNDFVAPHVPKNELAAVRASFDQDTRPAALGLTSLDDFRRANPHLYQASNSSLFDYIHEKYYPNTDKSDLARKLGYK